MGGAPARDIALYMTMTRTVTKMNARMNTLVAVCGVVFVLSSVSATEHESSWNMICNENVTRSVVISDNGIDNQDCLSNRVSECSTLSYVLSSTRSLTNVSCLKVKLRDVSVVHYLPSGAPALTGINFYIVSETGRVQITCSNSVETAITSYAVQNAEVAIFKSLTFSNCNRRLAVENISNAFFQDVTFR